ncbi:MAG: hypothetical protein EXR72_00875 [Myxococcales bacterium]|nr:hypothetical protein [Myxococcales bacterium]
MFRAVAQSGARAVLIGRQAVILLGSPVFSFDYDFWIHIDDAAALNRALEPIGLFPNRSPEEARKTGRYVLENDLRVDVLVARVVPTIDGRRIAFDDVWVRRVLVDVGAGIFVALPCIDDLIATKMFAARAKDAEDVAYLTLLRDRPKP